MEADKTAKDMEKRKAEAVVEARGLTKAARAYTAHAAAPC
jgi:hypothetical protein